MSASYSLTSVGQDHHRFLPEEGQGASTSSIRLAGLDIPFQRKFAANSDGDVVLHALCNAISGLSGLPFLGEKADALCRQGLVDSRLYVQSALQELYVQRPQLRLRHLSVSIEGRQPKLAPHIQAMRASLAQLLDLPLSAVALTATTGEGLTGMGQGEGLAVICLLSAVDLWLKEEQTSLNSER